MFYKRVLPPLGNRILKTAVAVVLCMLIYALRGFRGNVVTSAVAAVICMQPYAQDSKTFALNRIFGTVLGAFWALACLVLLRLISGFCSSLLLAYTVIGLIIVLTLYSTVVIKRSDVASLAAIIVIGAVATYPDVGEPLDQMLNTLVSTIIGTVVAVAVNISHLPRQKNPDQLFFVRTMDLVPDRFQQIPSSVHIALDHLLMDGARICLVSRWAPAFIISQMGLLNVNVPVIIMDGAALYDIRENRYLDAVLIDQKEADRLRTILRGFGVGCNIYTVGQRTTTIYRDGPVSEAEKKEFEALRRSPYRVYMDGLYHEDDCIVFIRVIDKADKIDELAYAVASVLPTGLFRMEVREEAHFPGYKGLYFYDSKASVASMKKRVQEIMEEEAGRPLEAVDMLPRISNYLPEHDALLLLSRLKNRYEPVRLFPGKNKGSTPPEPEA